MQRSKYGARGVLDPVWGRFDSTLEFQRFRDLQLMEHAGAIRDLRRQVPFVLHAMGGTAVAKYVADFTYEEKQDGEIKGLWRFVIEDVKGVRTPVYQLKRKWLAAEYGNVIREYP